MSDLCELIDLLEAAQSGRFDLRTFVSSFDAVYWNLNDRAVSGNSAAWVAVNELAEQLEYFDPVNQDAPGLFGETELRALIDRALLKCQLSNN
ncbi:hypothetical protein ACJO5Y_16385 [Marinobacter sp. GN3S48]|uniref:hypothetical protein n=1 Tax=Marinobacter sp. GN3S48 TaxID=3382302 RepID=UPI00387B0A8B